MHTESQLQDIGQRVVDRLRQEHDLQGANFCILISAPGSNLYVKLTDMEHGTERDVLTAALVDVAPYTDVKFNIASDPIVTDAEGSEGKQDETPPAPVIETPNAETGIQQTP